MARYLYFQDGRDYRVYGFGINTCIQPPERRLPIGTPITSIYTHPAETLGYIDSRRRYLYSQSGQTVGYFQPPYGGDD
jgi:hypothetical protein